MNDPGTLACGPDPDDPELIIVSVPAGDFPIRRGDATLIGQALIKHSSGETQCPRCGMEQPTIEEMIARQKAGKRDRGAGL